MGIGEPDKTWLRKNLICPSADVGDFNIFRKNIFHRKIYLDRRGIVRYDVKRKEEKPMSITSDILRGHTEAIILAHLLEKDSYGYQINKDIMKKTDNQCELKEATLYSAFRRLEQAGYIRTYWGDEKVGARRRYYSITEDGRRAYRAYKRDWEEAKAVIDQLLR